MCNKRKLTFSKISLRMTKDFYWLLQLKNSHFSYCVFEICNKCIVCFITKRLFTKMYIFINQIFISSISFIYFEIYVAELDNVRGVSQLYKHIYTTFGEVWTVEILKFLSRAIFCIESDVVCFYSSITCFTMLPSRN